MIFSIFKIFISNLFSFGGAFGEIKKGPKGIAKIIGIGLLVVFGLNGGGIMGMIGMGLPILAILLIKTIKPMPSFQNKLLSLYV